MKKEFVSLILLFLFLLILNISSVNAENSILNTFFRPFEDIDIAGLYDSYSVIIDLIIYLMVFIGLSQAILSKKFQGRGGKAVVIAVGLIMPKEFTYTFTDEERYCLIQYRQLIIRGLCQSKFSL